MKKIIITGTVAIIALVILGGRFYFVYQATLGGGVTMTSHKVSFEGYVDEDPSVRETRQRIVVTITKGEDSMRGERVVLSAPKFPKLEYGSLLKISGILEYPENFVTDKGEYNYRAYLAAKKIYYTVDRPYIQHVDGYGGSDVVRILLSFKKEFVHHLEVVLGEPHASLAAGLLVGEKHSLSDKLLNDFRRVGLTHVIVLSGYNIAIVVQTFTFILGALPRRIRIVASGISVVVFGVLVGGGATVIRSVIMALIALLGEYVNRDYSPLRALFIAGYGMAFHNPLILVYDPSFQLSFIATLGLIVLGKVLEKRFIWLPEKYNIRALIASTSATQIAVLPLILYISGSISVGGILVNFLVLPAVPLTMLFVFLTGITGFVSYWISWVCGVVSHILLEYELSMVTWWAKWWWMSFDWSISSTVAIVWYGVYFLLLTFWLIRNELSQQKHSISV